MEIETENEEYGGRGRGGLVMTVVAVEGLAVVANSSSKSIRRSRCSSPSPCGERLGTEQQKQQQQQQQEECIGGGV